MQLFGADARYCAIYSFRVIADMLRLYLLHIIGRKALDFAVKWNISVHKHQDNQFQILHVGSHIMCLTRKYKTFQFLIFFNFFNQIDRGNP